MSPWSSSPPSPSSPPNPSSTPPPPRPSPYYASSSSSSSRHRRQYTEKDYEEIYYHFEDYSGDILLHNASSLLTSPENPELYEWENLILEEASEAEWEGLKKSCLLGFAAGVGLLGGLRLGRGFLGGGFSRYRSSSSTSGSGGFSGGYKLDPNPHSTRNHDVVNAATRNNSLYQYRGHQQQQYQGRNNNSRMLFDITLSSLLGIGISLFALERDVFYPTTTTTTTTINETSQDKRNSNDKEPPETIHVASPPPPWISPQIPLVPGRSLLSDELCTPLTNEFRKFPKELWQSGSSNRGIENGYHNHMALYANGGWKDSKYYNGNPNASVVALGEHGDGGGKSHTNNVGGNTTGARGIYEALLIDSLQGFVINCERRSRYEEKLRRLKGLKKGDKTPVVIPMEGVPAYEDLELDDIYFVEENDIYDDD